MAKPGVICVSVFFNGDEQEPRKTLKSCLVFEDEYDDEKSSPIEEYKIQHRRAAESRKRVNNGNVNTVAKKARYEESTATSAKSNAKESLHDANDRTPGDLKNNDDITEENSPNNSSKTPTPDLAINTYKKDIKSANKKQFDLFNRSSRPKSKTNVDSPRGAIKLPKDIRAKKAVINVKSNDGLNFKWALLSAIYPVRKNNDRVSSYLMNSNKLKFDGVRFPVQLKDIHKVEEQNNISINVFGLEYNKDRKIHSIVGPLFLTKSCRDDHVNLLLVSGTHNHYCYIKNMSRLLSKQLSSSEHHIFICNACLSYFAAKVKLDKHTCTRIVTELPK